MKRETVFWIVAWACIIAVGIIVGLSFNNYLEGKRADATVAVEEQHGGETLRMWTDQAIKYVIWEDSAGECYLSIYYYNPREFIPQTILEEYVIPIERIPID